MAQFWRGWLQADLKRFEIPDAALEAGDGADTPLDSLPGLDIRVADFSLGNRGLAARKPPQKNERSDLDLGSPSVSRTPDGALGQAQWSRISGHRPTSTSGT